MTENKFWTEVASAKSAPRKRIQVNSERGGKAYLWVLDPAEPKIVKH